MPGPSHCIRCIAYLRTQLQPSLGPSHPLLPGHSTSLLGPEFHFGFWFCSVVFQKHNLTNPMAVCETGTLWKAQTLGGTLTSLTHLKGSEEPRSYNMTIYAHSLSRPSNQHCFEQYLLEVHLHVPY